MSATHIPTTITYEQMMALFQETREQFRESREQFRESREQFRETREQIAETTQQMRETDRRGQEIDRRLADTVRIVQATDRQIKKTNKKVGELTGSMGKVIERMVAGRNIIKQFHDLGYIISSHSRNKTFGEDLPDGNQGEIDLFLENGEIAILIEVKTTLKAKNVGKLKDKLERFRREADSKGDKRRFIGAVAGAVVEGDAEEIAHENGMYVIVQSGKAVEILPTPEGFVARQW